MSTATRVVVESFAGPGGWDEGARLIGLDGIIGHEKDKAAAATAEAAGFHRVVCDVTGVDYETLLAGLIVWGYIASPPCQAWSKAGKRLGILDQPAIFAHLDRIIAAEEWIDYPKDGWHDPRSPLVLEVVRAVLQMRPTWIALEQVPDVLPFWQRVAVLFSQLGYRVWCGVLDAEMYGVPQTRDRAILTASLDVALVVSRPPATHARYVHGQTPAADLFGELLPWVSMADALGWGLDDRPSWTVSGGGTETGGAEVFANANARRHLAEVVHHQARSSRSDTWVLRTGNNSMVTGRTGSHAGDGDVQPYERPVTVPAPTVDTNVGGKWRVHQWPAERPATTICGDSRVFQPGGHHQPGEQSANSIRITYTEAAMLQSFRRDYPWAGSDTAKFRQIGDAVPPLLAAAVLGNLLNLPWRDVCRDTYSSTERVA